MQDARKIESEFLNAARGRFDAAKRWLPGATFDQRSQDQRERLRELMKARRIFDFDLLDRMPQNRRSTLIGYERPWYWFGLRKVGAVTASVLSPLEAALDRVALGDEAPRPAPVDRGELAGHVDELAAERIGSHVIGVCSPGGFTEDAKRAALERPGVTLVLIEPHEAGGWIVTGVSGPDLDRACALFDLEGDARKLQRVRKAVEAKRAAVIAGGLNGADLAEELGVDEAIVETAFRQLAADDGRLHVTAGRRACILYYTATAVKETSGMSAMDFLRRILGREAPPEEKIRELRAKQVEIDDERRSLEKALEELTRQEGELLKSGGATTSPTVKRRLASQVAQLRQRIGLQGEKVSILSKQSQVLGRHVHNMEVAETARPVDLPVSEEITEAAAAAETALEELDETFEAVRTVGSAVSDQAMTEEETSILAEFEAEAARQAQPETKATEEPTRDDAEPSEPDRARHERQREAD